MKLILRRIESDQIDKTEFPGKEFAENCARVSMYCLSGRVIISVIKKAKKAGRCN